MPLLRNEKVIEAPVDRDYLVKRCTEEAISFIEQNRGKPWFVYIPHTMPGSTPHPFSSPAFRGKSANGDYGDAVEELDWSTGQILATLERLQLADNTFVIWTADNGAVLRNPPQGSCAPYRGNGYDTSEGAMRMPCVMRFPGRIPAGRVCDEIVSTMDLLPTFAQLAGAALPSRPIDGHDARALLFGDATAKSSWDEEGLMFYRMEQLQAVRSGRGSCTCHWPKSMWPTVAALRRFRQRYLTCETTLARHRKFPRTIPTSSNVSQNWPTQPDKSWEM